MVIYGTPSPVQAWRVEFDVLKGLIRMIGKRIRQIIYLKEEIKDYLTTKSKVLVQSYTQRVDWPTEKMGTPFLPPGVEEAGRETGYDPVVQGKRRKV